MLTPLYAIASAASASGRQDEARSHASADAPSPPETADTGMPGAPIEERGAPDLQLFHIGQLRYDS
jgi:hypothetical protein